MNYEITNILKTNAPDWNAQKDRLQRSNGTLITLAPDPATFRYQQEIYPNIINIVDYVTKRTYHPERFLFFNQVATVDGAEIFMNGDFSIDLKQDGQRIGTMKLYPNTRRYVHNITYLNSDGTRDFLEEYTFDGNLFSRIFYHDNKTQQILFYNEDGDVVLTYYFYNGIINLITVENPQTHQIIEQYNNTGAFLATKAAEIITKKDKVGISYLGIELTALSQTKSENILYMQESAFDNKGQVRGNLQSIFNDERSYIKYVILTLEDAQRLEKMGIKSNKVIAK